MLLRTIVPIMLVKRVFTSVSLQVTGSHMYQMGLSPVFQRYRPRILK